MISAAFPSGSDRFDGFFQKVKKRADQGLGFSFGSVEQQDEGIPAGGDGLGEIDLVIMLSHRKRFCKGIVYGQGEEGDEIFHQDLGMEVLIDGQGGFAGEIFQIDPAFDGLIIFFHGPAEVVQIGEHRQGVCVGIRQGSDQDHGVVRGVDADQSELEGLGIQSEAIGHFHGGGGDRQVDHPLGFTGSDKRAYDFPFRRDPGAKLAVHGKDQGKQPPCRISSVEQHEILRHQVQDMVGGQFPFTVLFRLNDRIDGDLIEGVKQLGDPGHGRGPALPGPPGSEVFCDAGSMGKPDSGAVHDQESMPRPGFGMKVCFKKSAQMMIELNEGLESQIHPGLCEGGFCHHAFGDI